MAKMFSKSICFVVAAISLAWCADSVVITGTITDSSSTPVAGIRVFSQPALFGSSSTVETKTDASGKYTLSNSATFGGTTVSAFMVSTSFPNAYQYTTTNIAVSGANIVANVKVPSRTPPPDSLLIKGLVLDTGGIAIKNVTVNFAFRLNNVLFPLVQSSASWDTLKFITGNDGSFSFSGLNVFAVKGGSFIVTLPAGFDTTKNKKLKTGNGSMKDSANANLFDGNLDSIIVPTFYLWPPSSTGTIAQFSNKSANPVNLSNPISVSIYSADGRLVRKVNNVKIDEMDKMISSLNFHGSKVLFAVWSQNGAKCSKRIMNLTRSKY